MVKAERFALYSINNQDGGQKLGIVISPNELNEYCDTVIIIPVFPFVTKAPFRLEIEFKGKDGEIAMEQITSIPSSELHKKIGIIPKELSEQMLEILEKMFS